MRNIRLDLCYDGTRYAGWQRLPGDSVTIQGKLEQTLSRILNDTIEISGSGRTDAGAHAEGQVANFHTKSEMDCNQLLAELRLFLPEDIGVVACKEVSERFHARMNAKNKTYCYRIWNSDVPCVFERRYVHVIHDKLDVDRMRIAAQYFLGEHDFSAFCANRNMKKSTVRRIDALDIVRYGNEIRITITGNGFLYNMVRIISGTLYEIGIHKRDPESIPSLFGNKRSEAGVLLPAKGLCLMEVRY